MGEQARERVDGDAGGTYAPLTEAEMAEVERLAAQVRVLQQEIRIRQDGVDSAKEDLAVARAEIERVRHSEAAVVREALAQVGALKADLARAVGELRSAYYAPMHRHRILGEALRSFGVDPESPVPPAERTPLVVLRAMLRAYEAAALDLAVSLARETGSTSHTSLWKVEEKVDSVRVALAHCIANSGRFPGADEPIERDYLDRLSGTRPLDAPPPGNRFPGAPSGEGAER